MNTRTRWHSAGVALAALLLLASCSRSTSQDRPVGSRDASAGQKRITFIELGSVNCIPCKAMQPILEELRKKYPDTVEVVFHDVWTKEGEPFARSFRIRVIPTQVFLDREGKEYHRHEGYLPLEEVLTALERGGLKR
jgi:thioredoxin 1